MGRADQGLPRPNSHLPPEEPLSVAAVYLQAPAMVIAHGNQTKHGARSNYKHERKIKGSSGCMQQPSAACKVPQNKVCNITMQKQSQTHMLLPHAVQFQVHRVCPYADLQTIMCKEGWKHF